MVDKTVIQKWYSNMWNAGQTKEDIKREFYINFHDNDMSELKHFIDPSLYKKKIIVNYALLSLVVVLFGDILIGLLLKFGFDGTNTFFRIPTFIAIALMVIGFLKYLKKSSAAYILLSLSGLIIFILSSLQLYYPQIQKLDFMQVDFTVFLGTSLNICTLGMLVSFLIFILGIYLRLSTNHDANIFNYKKQ